MNNSQYYVVYIVLLVLHQLFVPVFVCCDAAPSDDCLFTGDISCAAEFVMLYDNDADDAPDDDDDDDGDVDAVVGNVDA